MYSFKNDYSEGAHPNILNALINSNLEQKQGYGLDNYCNLAKEKIKFQIQNENADIHFVSGGTQANLIVISSILKPYESVIAVKTGHINVHETGAIESTGHKVCTVEGKFGKIYPEDIKLILNEHVDEHMVKPKLVYISNSTEIGSIYTKKDLTSLSEFCKNNNLYLFMDGARLGSAITSWKNDISLTDIANLVDIFYIGATKNAGLLGEAIVIINDNLKENFRFNMKQKGAILAKGSLLGIQFNELFKDNLFFDCALHANKMAQLLSDGLKKLNIKFLEDPSSNQIFPILDKKLLNKFENKFEYTYWCEIDKNHTCIRLVTSWATPKEQIEEFLNFVKNN